MFPVFIEQWDSLQQFSLKHFVIRVNNQLIPVLTGFLFVHSRTPCMMLLALLAFIYNHFNFKIRFKKNKKGHEQPLPDTPSQSVLSDNQVMSIDDPPSDSLDPPKPEFKKQGTFEGLKHLPKSMRRIQIMDLREVQVLDLMFVVCLLFTLFKITNQILLLSSFQTLFSENGQMLLIKISSFLTKFGVFYFQEEHDEIYDFTLLQVFTAYLILSIWANSKFKITTHFHITKIIYKILNSFCKKILFLLIVFFCFIKIYFNFDISIMSILEVVLFFYILFIAYKRIHAKKVVPFNTFANYFKYFCLVRMLIFIFFMMIVQIQLKPVRTEIYTIISPELTTEEVNINLFLSFIVYQLCSFYSFIFKFRSRFGDFKKKPRLKKLNKHPYKKHFFTFFSSHLYQILGLKDKDLAKKLTFSLDLDFAFYRDMKALSWFIKIFRNSIRKRLSKNNLSLGFMYKLNSVTYKFFGGLKLYKYAILRFFWSFLVILVLSFDTFEVRLSSVCNLLLIVCIVVFESYNAICLATFLFGFIPHTIFSLSYLIYLFINSSYEISRDFNAVFQNILHYVGMNDTVLSAKHCAFVHIMYATLCIAFLMFYRVLHQLDRRRKIKNHLQNIRSKHLALRSFDEDWLLLFSRSLAFVLSIVKYYIIYRYLTEALQFINIANGMLLVSMYAFLCLSPKGFKTLCATILSLFLLKFFSRYSNVFGIFENHYNLLYGFYFTFKDSLFSKLVLDLQGSASDVYFYNLYRLLVILTLQVWLKRLSQNTQGTLKKPPQFKTKFLSSFSNTLVELFNHCQNIINTTKIFFVYFSVYYFAFQYYSGSLAIAEISYCSFLLLFHLLIFKKRRNTANKLFSLFFLIYFLFVVLLFSGSYLLRLTIYLNPSPEANSSDGKFEEVFNENYAIMFPLCVKLILSTISVKAILLDFRSENLSLRSTNVSKRKTVAPLTRNSLLSEAQSVESLEDLNKSEVADFFINFASFNKQSISIEPGKKEHVDLRFLYSDRLDHKWYFRLAKMLSVFLREILLFFSILYFLRTPNLFKVCYLAAYLYYFVNQIWCLCKILIRYKLKDMLRAKIEYMKTCLLRRLSADRQPNSVDDSLLRSTEAETHKVYCFLFKKSIFNGIHDSTDRTWLLMFLVILLYLQLLFILKLFPYLWEKQWVLFVFNLDFKQSLVLKEELAKVLFVLVITVFELYFMNIIKSPKSKQEKEIIRAITDFNIAFYNYRSALRTKFPDQTEFTNALENYGQVMTKSHEDFKKYSEEELTIDFQELYMQDNEEIRSVLSNVRSINLQMRLEEKKRKKTVRKTQKITEHKSFLLNKRTPSLHPRRMSHIRLSTAENDPKNSISMMFRSSLIQPIRSHQLLIKRAREKEMSSMVYYLDQEQKTLLVSHHQQKLVFLECMLCVFPLFKRVILLPLILGVLLASRGSPFWIIIFMILFFSYNNRELSKSIDMVNISLAILVLCEYILIYLIDFDETLIHIPNSTLFHNYILQIQSDPLTGLPYMFLYTALAKSFFLLSIYIGNHSVMIMNRIRLPSTFKEIKGQTYRIVSFSNWKNCAYWPWDALKTAFLSSFPNIFFVLCIIFYGMGSEGIISKFIFICVFVVRLLCLFHWKVPLSHQISCANKIYVKLFSYLNFLVLIIYTISNKTEDNIWFFDVRIHSKVLFAVLIVANLVFLDLVSSSRVAEEALRVRRKKRFKNELFLLNETYTENENEILKNTREKLLTEHFEAKGEIERVGIDGTQIEHKRIFNKKEPKTKSKKMSVQPQFSQIKPTSNDRSQLALQWVNSEGSSIAKERTGPQNWNFSSQFNFRKKTQSKDYLVKTPRLFQETLEQEKQVNERQKLLAETGSLRYLSIFPNSEKYKRYLRNKLSLTQNFFARLKWGILNKIYKTNKHRNNFYELLGKFLHKNVRYANFQELDILRLVRNDYSQLEDFLEKVKRNSKLYKEAQFVQTVHGKIDEVCRKHSEEKHVDLSKQFDEKIKSQIKVSFLVDLWYGF